MLLVYVLNSLQIEYTDNGRLNISLDMDSNATEDSWWVCRVGLLLCTVTYFPYCMRGKRYPGPQHGWEPEEVSDYGACSQLQEKKESGYFIGDTQQSVKQQYI